MSEIIFNGALGITVPGGFEIISERELTGAGDRPGTSWGARDPQRHILVTVNAKKVPFLLGALAAMPKVRDNSLREVMKKVPGCRPGENFEISVAGSTAYGFRYDYTVRDVPQTGMYCLLKHKGYYYAVMFAGRGENGQEDRKVCEAFLQGLRLL